MRAKRRGSSLLELVVVIFLTGILAHASSRLLVVQGVAVRRMVQRSDVLATVRQARHTLGWEARGGAFAGQVAGLAGSSVDLRAYRGGGRVCSVSEDRRTVLVAVEGVRLPDAGKDSLVALGGGAPVGTVLDMESDGTAGATCPGVVPGSVRRWELSSPLPPGSVVLRYFERGSYRLARRALRYRRGGGGLQPMTPESLGDPAGRLEVGPAGAVEVRLRPRLPTDAPVWSFVVSPPWPLGE